MPRLDRGRAAPDQIEDRIARNAQFADFGRDCRLIDSGGVLEQVGDALVTLILKAASDRR